MPKLLGVNNLERGKTMAKRITTHPEKKRRRGDAEKRQALRDKRSRVEQTQVLDRRLGGGVGARKERARLAGVAA
ncbi:hypothetical protein SEA_KEELAN_68 [Gordonia phage Keelan]|nr:hypothetical protein SEA_KEELAN_68 [Gordonia phage Keelan]